MTCHEKLMHSFFLLTEKVTTVDVTHLAPFVGTSVHLGRLCCVLLSGICNPPTDYIDEN